MNPHPDAVHGLCWWDQNTFITGCEKGAVIGHDIRTKGSSSVWSFTLSQHPSICCLTVLKGMNVLLAGCTDGWIQVVSLQQGGSLSSNLIHSGDVRSVVAVDRQSSGPQQSVLTCSYDGTAALWSLDHQLRWHQSISLNGHSDKVLSAAVVPSSDKGGKVEVLTTGADGQLIRWF